METRELWLVWRTDGVAGDGAGGGVCEVAKGIGSAGWAARQLAVFQVRQNLVGDNDVCDGKTVFEGALLHGPVNLPELIDAEVAVGVCRLGKLGLAGPSLRRSRGPQLLMFVANFGEFFLLAAQLGDFSPQAQKLALILLEVGLFFNFSGDVGEGVLFLFCQGLLLREQVLVGIAQAAGLVLFDNVRSGSSDDGGSDDGGD